MDQLQLLHQMNTKIYHHIDLIEKTIVCYLQQLKSDISKNSEQMDNQFLEYISYRDKMNLSQNQKDKFKQYLEYIEIQQQGYQTDILNQISKQFINYLEYFNHLLERNPLKNIICDFNKLLNECDHCDAKYICTHPDCLSKLLTKSSYKCSNCFLDQHNHQHNPQMKLKDNVDLSVYFETKKQIAKKIELQTYTLTETYELINEKLHFNQQIIQSFQQKFCKSYLHFRDKLTDQFNSNLDKILNHQEFKLDTNYIYLEMYNLFTQMIKELQYNEQEISKIIKLDDEIAAQFQQNN